MSKKVVVTEKGVVCNEMPCDMTNMSDALRRLSFVESIFGDSPRCFLTINLYYGNTI